MDRNDQKCKVCSKREKNCQTCKDFIACKVCLTFVNVMDLGNHYGNYSEHFQVGICSDACLKKYNS